MTVRENFLSSQDIDFPLDNTGEGVAIFGFEGFMLPSKLEVEMAKKGGFDFYVITNISFMDIAHRLNYVPNVYVIGKKQIGNMGEIPQTDGVHQLLASAEVSLREMPEKVGGLAMPGFHEEINVKHNPDDLARAFEQMARVFRDHNCADAVVLEEEMFQLFLQDRQGVQVLKTLKVNLLDYQPDEAKHTFIMLVEREGQRLFLISRFTHYQTFVPFQAKMLSQRLVLSIGVKRIITCPNVWSLEGAEVG